MKAEEWDRDPIPPPPPQQQQQQQPQAPPPPHVEAAAPHEEAPAPHEEAPAPDDVPIGREEEEEPKKDTGEPEHSCVQKVCRAFYAFRMLSLHVSPAPSTRVQSGLHVLRAVAVYVPGDCLHVLRDLHSC